MAPVTGRGALLGSDLDSVQGARSVAAHIDPFRYLRFPKPDVAGALFLAKVLLQRVPKGASPPVREGAAMLEAAMVELRDTWARQSRPVPRDMRAQARRLGAAWRAVRDRLVACEDAGDEAERERARVIREMLFPDGLAWVKGTYARLHGESDRRLIAIEERGVEAELRRLVGERFVAGVRAAYEVVGDALGVNERAVLVVPVMVAGALRRVIAGIGDYALQLVAWSRLDEGMREAVVFALAPIDEYRAGVGRRVVVEDQDEGDAVVLDPVA